MFIVCWSNKKEEGWDIINSAKELQEKVSELINLKKCNSEDIMIFNYREDYITPEEDGKVILV